MDNEPNPNNLTRIISNKNGMKLTRKPNNEFNFECFLENENIYLDKIVNFEFIKLIFDINSDIYEKVIMNKIDEYNAEFTFIMKHLFADIGLPQRYYSFLLTKHYVYSENKIIFESKTIYHRPEFINKDIEFLPITKMVYECIFLRDNKNKMILKSSIIFDEELNIPEFVEKTFGMIIQNIFICVKQLLNI